MENTKNGKELLQDLASISFHLRKYLAENFHPHVTAIVTSTSIELVEGLANIPQIFDALPDEQNPDIKYAIPQ